MIPILLAGGAITLCALLLPKKPSQPVERLASKGLLDDLADFFDPPKPAGPTVATKSVAALPEPKPRPRFRIAHQAPKVVEACEDQASPEEPPASEPEASETEPEQPDPDQTPPEPAPPAASPKRKIEREHLEKVFEGGAKTLTRKQAVEALCALPDGFGKTAAYEALKEGGRFWESCLQMNETGTIRFLVS